MYTTVLLLADFTMIVDKIKHDVKLFASYNMNLMASELM
jgi:hypothetical protein